VSERAKRDITTQETAEEVDAVEKSRKMLEKKARLYDTLQHQRRGSSDNDEEDTFLVDFDRKYTERLHEKSPVTLDRRRRGEEEDPWVEYEDEFGRTRVVRRSALPQRSPSPPRRHDSRSPSPMMMEYADRAGIRHYDAGQEIRTKGVGHYSFATDDNARLDQMASLNALRQETETARKQSRSASDRRRAILAKRAEWVHQRWAKIRRHKEVDDEENSVNEDSVTQLLQTMRNKVTG
jgi:hypothetical protein